MYNVYMHGLFMSLGNFRCFHMNCDDIIIMYIDICITMTHAWPNELSWQAWVRDKIQAPISESFFNNRKLK